MTGAHNGVDRRIQAMAALGAFYLRQGFPDRARKLLAAADRLMADDPGALHDRAAQEATARNLAYALLLSGDGAGALALLTSGRIAPQNAADAAALAHLTRRAQRRAGTANKKDNAT